MFDKKLFFYLFWPVLIEQVLTTTIGIVNTMMVSGLGIAALSAVSIVDSLNYVIMNLFIAFATGATVIVAQLIGAKDLAGANKTSSQSMTACVLTAIASGLAFISFGLPVINMLFGVAEEQVKANAIIYLNFSAVSYPFLAVYSMAAGILRAGGNTRSPMRASILSNIVNAGVGALCIYVLGMGVAGAGIALLLSRITAAGLLSGILFRNESGASIKKITFKIQKEVIGPVIRIGLPACIDGLIFNGGKLLIQTLVATLGTISLAANGIAGSVTGLINIPGNAMAIVAVTIVGQAVGGGVFGKELKKIIRTLNLYAMGLLTVSAGLLVPLMPYFLLLYAPPAEVKDLVLTILHIALVFMPLTWPIAFILPSCIRSTGDAVWITIASILSMWFIRVMGAWFTVNFTNWGLIGIWVFWCLDWVVRGVAFVARTFSSPYVSGKRRLNIPKNV